MKISLKIITLSLVCIFFLSASGNKEKKKITQVANKYLKALYKDLDPLKAKEFATQESIPFLDLISQVHMMSGDIEIARKESKNAVIELGEITIKNETAKVCFSVILNDEKTEEVLQLKKVDEKWLVHQTKESPASEEEDLEMLEGFDETIFDEIIIEE